jgi:hypothetical protein
VPVLLGVTGLVLCLAVIGSLLWLGVTGSVLAGRRQSNESQVAQVLLSRVEKAYRRAQSYADSGEFTEASLNPFTNVRRTFSGKFETSFVAPNRFRFEVRYFRNGKHEGSRTVVLAADSLERAKTWTTIHGSLLQRTEDRLAVALHREQGASKLASVAVPGLLLPDRLDRIPLGDGKAGVLMAVTRLQGARLVGEEMVEDVLCYRIDGRISLGQSPAPTVLWISKEDSLIRRISIQLPTLVGTTQIEFLYAPTINVKIPLSRFRPPS